MFDAKRRLAEWREAWDEPALADRLDHEADELRDRFDDAYWIDQQGRFFALALDGDKQQVESLCSNVGHLLGVASSRSGGWERSSTL